MVVADIQRRRLWQRWAAAEPRVALVESFEEVLYVWGPRRDERRYEVLAGLCALGSQRGADDDDAALAVVVMLAPGISKMARDLSNVTEIADLQAAVWEAVKRAEPQLGHKAAQYLLQRAHQRLTNPWTGLVSPRRERSLDAMLTLDGVLAARLDPTTAHAMPCPLPAMAHPAAGAASSPGGLAAPEDEDPARELADLLVWARRTGVLEASDVDLLIELIAAAHDGVPAEDAQRRIGQRDGVGARAVRRRRAYALARLREAGPAYLASTA